MIKKIKVFLKLLLVLIIAIALFIDLSIPIARLSERHVTNPGVALSKIFFRHATIIPMDSSYVLNNHALFIDNNKIVAVLPDSLATTTDYTGIDASGKYILPGLVDMHSHIFDRSDLTNFLSYGVTHVRNMMGFLMHLRWKSRTLTLAPEARKARFEEMVKMLEEGKKII